MDAPTMEDVPKTNTKTLTGAELENLKAFVDGYQPDPQCSKGDLARMYRLAELIEDLKPKEPVDGEATISGWPVKGKIDFVYPSKLHGIIRKILKWVPGKVSIAVMRQHWMPLAKLWDVFGAWRQEAEAKAKDDE